MRFRRIFLLFFFVPVLAWAPLGARDSGGDAAVRAGGAETFVAEMVRRHRFVPGEIERMLAAVRINPKIVALMDAPRDPSRKVYWREYRANRMRPADIAAGVRFFRDHRETLARAEMEYGVPPEIITAILGVETRYGKVLGNFQVAEALATLAFGYPRRADEFRKQLEHFLLFARENRIDALALRGSYAGAFGAPQFLPESARLYAADFNNDGRADLFDMPDAIGSVGNFLRAHGWKRGGPVSFPARVTGDPAVAMRATEAALFKPTMTREALAEAGVEIVSDATPPGELYLLADLENRLDTEYRAAAANFYALTRYNNSFKYAAAVQDLAEAIRERA